MSGGEASSQQHRELNRMIVLTGVLIVVRESEGGEGGESGDLGSGEGNTRCPFIELTTQTYAAHGAHGVVSDGAWSCSRSPQSGPSPQDGLLTDHLLHRLDIRLFDPSHVAHVAIS